MPVPLCGIIGHSAMDSRLKHAGMTAVGACVTSLSNIFFCHVVMPLTIAEMLQHSRYHLVQEIHGTLGVGRIRISADLLRKFVR